MNKEREHLGYFYGILAALSYSLMVLFVKLSKDVPIPAMVFIRFLFGLLILMPVLIKQRVKFSLKHLPTHLVRDLSGLAALYCFFYATEKIPLVNATTLMSTAPLFVPLIVLVHHKLIVPKLRMLGLLIGFVGVVTIVKPTGANAAEPAEWIGLAAGVLAAVAYVTIRKLSRVESTSTILFTYFLVSAVVSFPLTLAFWKPIESSMLGFYLLLICIFGTVYQYFLTKAYTHTPPSKASAMTYLSVIFSGLLGWLALGEVPTMRVLIGVVLIISGGLIIVFDKEDPRIWGSKKSD